MSHLAMVAMVVLARPPAVEVGNDVKEALRLLAADPPIAKVQQAALRNFRVEQGDIAGYRTAARLQALMPTVTGSYAQDDSKATVLNSDRLLWQSGAPFNADDPQTVDARTGIGRAYVASVSWNLRSIIFNPQEIEAYALVGIYEDVLKEVTRLYYTRQHNIIALALDPPDDARARAALVLRTNEINAMLDAFTGGAWSKMKRPG